MSPRPEKNGGPPVGGMPSTPPPDKMGGPVPNKPGGPPPELPPAEEMPMEGEEPLG